jgi:hypothetical protein
LYLFGDRANGTRILTEKGVGKVQRGGREKEALKGFENV